jgi:hypothetical protein
MATYWYKWNVHQLGKETTPLAIALFFDRYVSDPGKTVSWYFFFFKKKKKKKAVWK